MYTFSSSNIWLLEMSSGSWGVGIIVTKNNVLILIHVRSHALPISDNLEKSTSLAYQRNVTKSGIGEKVHANYNTFEPRPDNKHMVAYPVLTDI